MSKLNVIEILGFSGVGKSALVKDLATYSSSIYHRVVTATTREKREGEINGVDYFFLSKEEFEKHIKEKSLIEYAKFNGNYYGTPISSFHEKKINLVVLEPSGVMSFYNHPRINLINIVNVEREYSLVLNSITDEKRIRQITSRRMSKEEEKEFAKIPDIVRNQIINFENNSSDIRYASINFNKIFNMTNVVNLYNLGLKEFMKENLQIVKKAASKTKNETLSFLLKSTLNEGLELYKEIDSAKEKNDVFYMAKVNSFMDNLEVVKTFNKYKTKASNLLTRNTLMDIHSRVTLLAKYEFIKDFHKQTKDNWSEDKRFIFDNLSKDIKQLKNSNGFIERKIFRNIEKNLVSLMTYKSLLEKKILNPLVLNSSFIVDYAHIQYEKYKKRHFRLTIDEEKLDYLNTDIIYKLFFNNGVKENLDVMFSNDGTFSVYIQNKPIVVFELNEKKIKYLTMPIDEIIEDIKENKENIKHLPTTKQTFELFDKLSKEGLLDKSYNTNLYIKSDILKEKVESIVLRNYDNSNEINYKFN